VANPMETAAPMFRLAPVITAVRPTNENSDKSTGPPSDMQRNLSWATECGNAAYR